MPWGLQLDVPTSISDSTDGILTGVHRWNGLGLCTTVRELETAIAGEQVHEQAPRQRDIRARPAAPDLRRSLQDALAVPRAGCPFCDGMDEHRLTAVAVDGEGGLRIDYCEACGDYLKTYDGEGNESGLSPTGRDSISITPIRMGRGSRRASRDADLADRSTQYDAARPMPPASRRPATATGLRSTRDSSRASPTRSVV